jgi:mannosyltransferase OCH1-like enzyme
MRRALLLLLLLLLLLPRRPPRIPRVIYQTHSVPLGALEPRVRAQIDEMRARNPTFEYRYLDERQSEAFIERRYGPALVAAYRSINPEYGPARADLLRYLVLYAEGGVYLDVKSSTAVPLESVLSDDDEYLLSNWCEGACGRANWDWLLGTGFGEYQQWWIASRPGHPFLLAAIRRCLANIAAYRYDPHDEATFGKQGVLRLTGPIAYTQAIFPIAARHAHRFEPSAFGGAFVYSFGSAAGGEHALGPRHYSRLTTPIVLRDPVT